MNVYLLRHGLAVERGEPGVTRDSDRPLTGKGRRKLKQIAQAMETLDLSFELVLSSPYVRARQTAELVAEALGAGKHLRLTEALTPGGSRSELIKELRATKPAPENVLLVGHEPYLSELASWLLAGDPRMALTFKKGGLCKLTVKSFGAGRCACLEWLLTPKQMALIR